LFTGSGFIGVNSLGGGLARMVRAGGLAGSLASGLGVLAGVGWGSLALALLSGSVRLGRARGRASLLHLVDVIGASGVDLAAPGGGLDLGSGFVPVLGLDGGDQVLELLQLVHHDEGHVDEDLFDVAAELTPVGEDLLVEGDGGLDVFVEHGDDFGVSEGLVAGGELFEVEA